jgi:fatty-acyl-CoA synthase
MLRGLDLGVDADRIASVDDPATRAEWDALVGTPLPELRPAPEDLFLLIFTSGSTGAPKAVRMTHHRAARTAGRVPFSPDDVLYSAMPLFHGNALAAAIFPAFMCGSTVVLRRRFSASAFLPDVRECGATFFNTVGRAIAHIVATPPTAHDRDHQLKYVLGPETAATDKAAFTERFGVPLFEGYGSSENAIILVPTAEPRPGSLGTARPEDGVAVVDPDTGDERPSARFDAQGRLLNGDEAIGEIVGRNARSNFEGYYRNPEADAERTRNGWYWSGDLAYRDEDGVFYFAGRSGDWLRVDSENFAAAPVERILARFPAAKGVAVHAVPDARTGDQVMAVIELLPGARFDPDEFARFLEAQPDLGTKWAPRYVRIVGALPATATDKVDKAPLRATRWDTADPVWHRPPRTDTYVPFTDADRNALLEEFAANDRTNLLT